MSNGKFVGLIVAGLVALVIGMSAFTVNERELAIKLQVGEVVGENYEPGLYFKIPIIQTVVKFPKRILTTSNEADRIFTADRQALQVDVFVKWRISDTVKFYTSTSGRLSVGNERLAEIIQNSVVTEFGKRTVQEAISTERAELMQDMLLAAGATAEGLGIEVVDVRVMQVEFPDDVRNSVYLQMREERGRIAAERRAEGVEVSEKKKSTADRERTVLLANANRDSQIIRGQGDATATEIYAAAYSQDAEFYRFYRSINAYRSSVGQPGDILVINPDNDFFRYLNSADGSK